jgi:hypothetical protein
MDTLTRTRDGYTQAARDHEIADLKEALDEVGSSHPLLVFAYEEEAGPDRESPLDGVILEGLVHP